MNSRIYFDFRISRIPAVAHKVLSKRQFRKRCAEYLKKSEVEVRQLLLGSYLHMKQKREILKQYFGSGSGRIRIHLGLWIRILTSGIEINLVILLP